MTPSTISSLTSIKPLVLWLCTTLGLLWVSTDRGSLLLWRLCFEFRLPPWVSHLDNTIHPITNTHLLISPRRWFWSTIYGCVSVYKLWSREDSHSLSIQTQNFNIISFLTDVVTIYNTPGSQHSSLLLPVDCFCVRWYFHYLVCGVHVIWVITRACLPSYRSNIHQCTSRFGTIWKNGLYACSWYCVIWLKLSLMWVIF